MQGLMIAKDGRGNGHTVWIRHTVTAQAIVESHILGCDFLLYVIDSDHWSGFPKIFKRFRKLGPEIGEVTRRSRCSPARPLLRNRRV